MAESNKQETNQSNSISMSTGSHHVSSLSTSLPEGNESSKENLSSHVTSKPSSDVREGHRMHQLRKGLERTVDKCVSAGRYSLFLSHLPALAEKNPRSLKAIHSQYQQKLKENIQCEIETMFKEENIATLMGELDQLIGDTADTSDGAWRPSADVKENLRPHVMAVKERQRKRLQENLSEIESQTKQLQEALSRKRHRLHTTIRQCKSAVERQVSDG